MAATGASFSQFEERGARWNWFLKRRATTKWGKRALSLRVHPSRVNRRANWNCAGPAATFYRQSKDSSQAQRLRLHAMEDFPRIQRLPPYVFNITGELKANARRAGEDIIDFGMGNPDGATPQHIVDKMIEAARRQTTHRYSLSKGIPRLRKAIC